MKRLILCFLFFISAYSFSANAIEVADTEVAEHLQLDGIPALQLNGAGVRSKFFMDLYVGSLYLNEKTSSASKAIESDFAAIKLTILSGLITSEKMEDAIREGFDDATHHKTAPIEAKIDRFIALFKDEIKVNDNFLLVFIKGKGVTAYKNGAMQATINGDDFRVALMKIWLGDKPAQKSLKKALLSSK